MRGSNFKKGVPILAYHAVSDQVYGVEELFVKPSEFYRQMKYLRDNGYTPLSFDELHNYDKYKNPIIISFDDGYVDNYYNAYPILKQFNFKATIFITANFIDKNGYLATQQIKEMSDIISFQSHTLSHLEMDKKTEDILKAECTRSKEIIESITNKPVIAIAYPYGRYNQTVLEVVSDCYHYGVTTKFGIYYKNDNKLDIGRICISRSLKINTFIGYLF